jgi:phage shock protein PspC (stress-responsive transcriptional regulator)
MSAITTGADGYYHPKDEEQVRQLILRASKEGLQVRVRGSGHSIKHAIYTDSFGKEPPRDSIEIMLDQLNFEGSDEKVRIDKAKREVRVKAGCHLGEDPYDIAGVSSLVNSLLYQLDQQGFAVPDLGGIIHQTVGGFLATGSSGGSLMGSFGEQLIGLRLVNGNGEILDLRKDRLADSELFYAAGVSMGLFGVITEATFSLVPRFDIIGEQTTTTVDDCTIDLFGPGDGGKPSLEQFLRETQYARLMWWPQNKVERMVVWKARDMEDSDYNQETGSKEHFKPKPYMEFPKFGKSDIPTESGSEALAEAVGGLFYSLAGNWHLLLRKLRPSWPVRVFLNLIAWLYPRHILPAVINAFVPLDTDLDPISHKPSGPQKFWDVWWHGLPMDNDVDDKLMPTDFTEIWIPISDAKEVMRELRDFYRENGYTATGSYSCELYSAMKSDFWMSPAYRGDMFRVDVFWFGYNEGNPATDYYPQFWDLLTKKFECRFHWGKHMPVNPEYLARQYPRWNEFMALRRRMDPNQIFVTQYWRDRLGIEPYTRTAPLKRLKEEAMSKPARTIFYFGFYMILEVILLLWSPAFLMKLARIDASDAVWLRLIGGIVAGLAIYYFRISLKQIKSLYVVPVFERSAVFLTTLLLYLFNDAALAVLAVGIVDFLGAMWTLWAIKSSEKG